MGQLNVKLKQRGVNELLWMQANDYGEIGMINQEIFTTIFPKIEYYQVVNCVKHTNILQ